MVTLVYRIYIQAFQEAMDELHFLKAA